MINIGQGRYHIKISPQQRGRHQLSIEVNDTHITGSPFSFKARMAFTALSKVKELSCSRPFGLTCSGSTVLMLEEGKGGITRLTEQRFDGFITITSQFLAELTTDRNDNIYVTTGESNGVLKLNSTGKVLKSVGSTGNQPLEFNLSNGININSLDEIYICDTGNHRIQVLDTDLDILRILTRKGKGRKPFQCPHDVDFDKLNNTYILESQRIQVLNQDGHTVRTIGEGKLQDAVCIKIVGNSIFVTDYGRGCISVFSTDGKFIIDFGKDFGEDSFVRPQGLTIDSDGFVYVTTNRNSLYIF